MNVGEMKITTKEYESLVRENERMALTLELLTNTVIKAYEGSTVFYIRGEEIASILGIELKGDVKDE